MKSMLSIFAFMFCCFVHAQVKIGGTPASPHASAVLELDGGSNRGFLLPRMRKIDIDAIQNPADGLTIYAFDEQAIYLRRSANWIKLNGSSDAFSLPSSNFFISNDIVFAIQNVGSGACFTGNNVGSGPGIKGFSQTNTGVVGVAQDSILGIGGSFYNNGGGRSLISMGRTGIGTSNPTALLHINGNNTSGSTVIINDDAGPTIQLQNSGANKGYVQVDMNNMVVAANITNAAGKVLLRTSDIDRLSVNPDGRIIIGSPTGTSPAGSQMLKVKGGIQATDFTVTALAAWPDYVFSDSYNLKSLEETEAFIKTNKHLPNIPSAAVVEKDGFALGDMQKRMMEKIEELTLYLIDSKKEINILKQQVSTLQSKN